MLFDDIAKVIVNFDTLSSENKFLLLLGSQQTYINLLVINDLINVLKPEPCITSNNRFILSYQV